MTSDIGKVMCHSLPVSIIEYIFTILLEIDVLSKVTFQRVIQLLMPKARWLFFYFKA